MTGSGEHELSDTGRDQQLLDPERCPREENNYKTDSISLIEEARDSENVQQPRLGGPGPKHDYLQPALDAI